MLVVDTNILIYAVDRSAPEHGRCREWLDEQRRHSVPWYLTWPIVYEFLRVATHPRVFRNPMSTSGAWSFIEACLESPALTLLVPGARRAAVASQTFLEIPDIRGNLMHDAHTAILMREHGVRTMCTRDMDFQRFPFLSVVDPLTG